MDTEIVDLTKRKRKKARRAPLVTNEVRREQMRLDLSIGLALIGPEGCKNLIHYVQTLRLHEKHLDRAA